MCGSTTEKWTEHLFSYNKIASYRNIKTFFYRFEFQRRGTLHLHMLVWLKDIRHAQHQFIRADIPRTHPNLAFLVHKLQPSDKRSHCLNLQYENSFFRLQNGKHVQHLKYPAEEFALNLRAYIATILPALKCRMDYQTTDGVAVLLRYVTSYVSKSQDSTQIDSMYSYELQGRQAAVRYLMQNTPAEPEMWFFLFAKKVAWSNSRTKQFVVPTSESVTENKTVLKYCKREKHFDDLNLIQWLHLFNSNSANPKPYKHGSTLVGAKILSIFNNEHFFQYVLLYLPHRDFQVLRHPNHAQLPEYLQWYAAAAHHFPDIWTNEDNLKSLLIMQGHRDHFVATVLCHIASMHDLLYLLQIQVITGEQLQTPEIPNTDHFNLDQYQLAVVQHIDTALLLRQQYYENKTSSTTEQFSSLSESDDDSECETDSNHESYMPDLEQQTHRFRSTMRPVETDIHWEKPILLMGKPGSGKSQVICHSVVKNLAKQKKLYL